MKKFFGLFLIVCHMLALTGCEQPVETQPGKSPVVIYDGAVELSDKKFGLYYGDRYNDGIGVYYVVLSDAMCFRSGFSSPYMDSEGDMLVLEFNGPVSEDDSNPRLPDGVYSVGDAAYGAKTVNPANSYVQKFANNLQSRYGIKSGKIHVATSSTGGYSIYTEDLQIVKGSEELVVNYSYDGTILLDDYKRIAPSQVGLDEDVIDMPFYEVNGGYYGNIYGYGSANYMITMSTKGFSDDDTNTLPGMMLVLNLFDLLPKGDDKKIAINPGTYTVQTFMNGNPGTMLYGLSMSTSSGAGSPFGTFFYQITAAGQESVEYINEGTVNILERSEEPVNGAYRYTLEYDLRSADAGRSYKGSWSGPIPLEDLSTDSKRLVISTLEEDVECDMSKVEVGTIAKIETLQSSLNTDMEPRFNLKTVWQVNLQPRDWTREEKENYEWDERLEQWTPDGDHMILEFVLPVDSNGEIAPSPEYEYTYTVQPNCTIDDDDYTMCVSQMGRPYDDLFHPETSARWGYSNYLWFPKEFDYCNSRRGFTFDGWFRGVFYVHYADGKYFVMDEYAPAVKGTIKVYRKGNVYKFTWDLMDDAESPNKITGTWEGQLKRSVSIN